MSDRRTTSEILAELADDFVRRYRRGERPTAQEYSATYPELAEKIQEIISALITVERRRADADSDGSPQARRDDADGSNLHRLGDFRIIRQIGRGGMGIVYEAEQMSLGRHVALKVLPQQMLLDECQKRRFEREARSAAKLHHTNIVPVFGVGENHGLHYYVMQFIEGLGLDEVLKELQRKEEQSEEEFGAAPAPLRVSRRDLTVLDVTCSLMATSEILKHRVGETPSGESDVQRQEAATEITSRGASSNGGAASAGSTAAGRLSDTFALSNAAAILPVAGEDDETPKNQPQDYWHSVANIGAQVASALQYAHEQGVFHRDVKPSNLLLDTHGTVWVLDFGLAKASDQHDLTHTGDVLGTLRYMPPEAFEGQADARSDLYSLGLTLYELLALQPAFNEKARQVTGHQPTRLDKLDAKIPRDLVTIVHKAIEGDPDRRYQTSGELGDDLKRFLRDEPIRARRISALEHVDRWARRNRALAASVATIALLLATINIAGPILTIRLKHAYDAEVLARSRADQAEREAVEALHIASQKETEALQSLELAKGQEKALSRTLYRAEMSLAGQAAAERTGIERVWGMTTAWRPTAGAEDLRDWEWYYLHGLGRLAQQTLQVDGGNAESIAWSPNGVQIAYGRDDGTVVVWNVRTARTLLRMNLHNAHVLHLCWNSDGTELASLASQDSKVRVWDPLTGREIRSLSLPGTNDWSGSVSFSRNDRLLAADSHKEIAIWNLQSGEKLRTLTMTPSVAHVAWSPVDDRIAASSKDRQIKIWNGLTGEQLAMYDKGAGCIAWEPTGERLAFAGQDRRIHILDLRSDRITSSSIGHVAEITTLAWNRDATRLASGGKDATVRIWDPQTGDEIARLRGHTGSVTSLAWHPGGTLLATSARDRTVKIWSIESTEERLVLQGSAGPVNSISWGRRGRRLATSSGSWTNLWDVDQQSKEREYQGQRAALSPNGEQLAIAGGANIEIRDTRTGDLAATLGGHSEGITALVWNAEGSRLASASWDGTARIWIPATEKILTTIPLSHRDREICWSPDGVFLATIGNRDVQIWDAESGTRRIQFQGQDQIHAVAWSPDGRHVASGGWGNEITIWDASTAAPVRVLTGHTSPVTSLCWSPSGTRLASGSEDQLVRIWDVESRGELLSLHGHTVGVTSVGWSPDGMRIASGDRQGRIVLWDAAPGHFQEGTLQALDILDHRIEANPCLRDLALRRDVLEKMGRAEAARAERRRIGLIREEDLEHLLSDRLAVASLAKELLTVIQAERSASWSVLSPLRMKATSGATLTVQPDKSIYVTGPNTAGVQYEVVAKVNVPITGLRLEAIPDSRLPHGGSGRATENGNFHVAEIEVFALDSAESDDTVRKVAIRMCCDDTQHVSEGRGVAKLIDGNRRTLWDTYPDHKQPHWAVFQFAQPLVAEADELVIKVRLDSGISRWGPHGLGRYRLSVTDVANVGEREQMLHVLKRSGADGVAFLAGAYAVLGERQKSASAFAAALQRAEDPDSQRATIAMATRFGVVGEVAKLLPQDPRLKPAQDP